MGLEWDCAKVSSWSSLKHFSRKILKLFSCNLGGFKKNARIHSADDNLECFFAGHWYNCKHYSFETANFNIVFSVHVHTEGDTGTVFCQSTQLSFSFISYEVNCSHSSYYYWKGDILGQCSAASKVSVWASHDCTFPIGQKLFHDVVVGELLFTVPWNQQKTKKQKQNGGL